MADSEEVKVRFGADTSDAEAGIQNVGEKLRNLNPEVRELIEAFGGLRRTFVEAFAADKISDFVEHIASLGETAIRSSEMLGIGVEKVQELGFAATMVGGSSEGMNIAIERLSRNMADIADPTSMAAKAFAALGMHEQDIKNKSPDQVLGMIADKFENAKDGADKTAIAMDLMGRSGAQMIPLLNLGSEGLERMGLVARTTGSVLTDFQAEGLEKTAQGITTLKSSLEGAGIAIVEEFKPGIDTLISGFVSLTQTFTALVKLINIATEAIEGGLLLGLAKVSEYAEEMAAKIGNTFNTIKLKAEEVAEVLKQLATGNLQGAVNAQASFEEQIAAGSKKASTEIQGLETQYEVLKQRIEAATTAAIQNTLGISGGAGGGGSGQLHAPSTGADATTQAAMEEYQEKVRLLAQELNQYKETLDAEVDLRQLSKGKEIDLEKAAFDTKYSMMIDELEQEAKISGLTVQQQQKINDQILTLQSELYTKELQLAAQAAKEQDKIYQQELAPWKKLLDDMGSAFDTMINGVLQGTQTWRQAIAKAFDDLAIKFTEVIAKMTAEFLVFEATSGKGLLEFGTTNPFAALGGITGGAGQAAGGAGSQAATQALTQAITASATATTGLIPTITANIAALAANTSALILNKALPSYDVGSWNIPSDTQALVHSGEMILPANVASQVRSGAASVGGTASAGGGTVILNVSAVDGQSVANLFKSNGAAIASVLQGQMRNNNTSLRTAMMAG